MARALNYARIVSLFAAASCTKKPRGGQIANRVRARRRERHFRVESKPSQSSRDDEPHDEANVPFGIRKLPQLTFASRANKQVPTAISTPLGARARVPIAMREGHLRDHCAEIITSITSNRQLVNRKLVLVVSPSRRIVDEGR